MIDPTEFYLIYKQANEGEERDMVILEWWWSLNKKESLLYTKGISKSNIGMILIEFHSWCWIKA
jgi:hypothetical protein